MLWIARSPFVITQVKITPYIGVYCAVSLSNTDQHNAIGHYNQKQFFLRVHYVFKSITLYLLRSTVRTERLEWIFHIFKFYSPTSVILFTNFCNMFFYFSRKDNNFYLIRISNDVMNDKMTGNIFFFKLFRHKLSAVFAANLHWIVFFYCLND